MSRRAFRIDVEDPRPASAWTLVVVASATLWLTQQIAIWAIAIQVVAIVLSLWRRRAPFNWQANAIALNLGMMGVTAATIHVALQGGPATLGLAHFAVLAQGLQLIDARPRRTEIPLVALPLLQVILASNTTDSAFFTPLIIASLCAASCPLLVHPPPFLDLGCARDSLCQSVFIPGAHPALARFSAYGSGIRVPHDPAAHRIGHLQEFHDGCTPLVTAA